MNNQLRDELTRKNIYKNPRLAPRRKCIVSCRPREMMMMKRWFATQGGVWHVCKS